MLTYENEALLVFTTVAEMGGAKIGISNISSLASKDTDPLS